MGKKPAYKVLVVDDDAAVCSMLAELLRTDGLDVLTAGSSAAGCEILQNQRIDLVLLDWDLLDAVGAPGMGNEVLSVCAKLDATLPVIVLSGGDEQTVRKDALSCGADSFIPKTLLDTKILLRHIRFLLRKRHRTGTVFQPRSKSDIIPMKELQYQYVKAAVAIMGGKKQAAERLGMNRQTVTNILNRTEASSDATAVPT